MTVFEKWGLAWMVLGGSGLAASLATDDGVGTMVSVSFFLAGCLMFIFGDWRKA